MTTDQSTSTTPLTAPQGWVAVWQVAWTRAWQFTGVLRRDSPQRMAAARKWSWQWAVVAWQAVSVFPALLLSAAGSSAQILTIPGASARVRRVGAGRWPTLSGAVLAVVFAAALFFALLAAVTAAAMNVWLYWAVVTVLVLWLSGLALCLLTRRGAQSLPVLERRAALLAAGRPAVVVADVVADRQLVGAGSSLMAALADRWTREGIAVAVLWAGSAELVDFYADRVGGWRLDADSPRRMVWTVPGGAR